MANTITALAPSTRKTCGYVTVTGPHMVTGICGARATIKVRNWQYRCDDHPMAEAS